MLSRSEFCEADLKRACKMSKIDSAIYLRHSIKTRPSLHKTYPSFEQVFDFIELQGAYKDAKL